MSVLVKTKAQIGRCGELLVQYRLLKNGIDSSSMTTDTGIDLVAFFPKTKRALTIQVKTNLQPKKAGGRGQLALDWWLPKDSHADLVALVDLGEDRVWLFSQAEFRVAAQQQSKKLHFYFYTESRARPRQPGRMIHEFEPHTFENRILQLLDS